jgi:hypothetical protein
VSSYLHSAARALEQILSEMHPEYDWTVSVRPEHVADGHDHTAPSVGLEEPGAVPDDAGAIAERDAAPASGRPDEDGLDEAA